jgi:RNA polymerase sigma factor (sigma-70 family)
LWRLEFPRLVASAARITHDVSLAEQVAQDAFVAALTQWPNEGMPDRPGAWLLEVARRRAVDVVRRDTTRDAKYRFVAQATPSQESPMDDLSAHRIDDDVLRLMFVCCHPVLGREARVALTLRLIGGLTTDEVANAQLVPSKTAGQRISRAKQKLAESETVFDEPSPDELAERLSSVLEVVYLVFNEGYVASSGTSWIRVDLAGEALRLARMLAHLAPAHADAHGLLALMELQASRFAARHGPDGPVLLDDQDRSRWDRLLIRRGLEGLARAERLGGGPYTAQAAIAACHARAATAEATDWLTLASLYDDYALAHPGPVVELNRAVAHWKAYGPAAAQPILAPLLTDGRVNGNHLLHSVIAEIAIDAHDLDTARNHLRIALELATNDADARVLRRKLLRIDAAERDQ